MTNHIDLTSVPASNLPVPFDKEQLHKDALMIFWHQLRVTSLFVAPEKLWPLSLAGGSHGGGIAHGDFWCLDSGPEECDVPYSAIRESTFAKCLEQQYDFAFHGLVSDSGPSMEMDGDHTWVALFLCDLSRALVVLEIGAYGATELEAAVKRCFHACELANARRALEDQEIFSYFAYASTDDRSEHAPYDGLTIHQLALLSGLEEMSVRTAASRKGPNMLPTYKEGGRTLVRSEDAREWLKAKGRYITITRHWVSEGLALEKTKFSGLGDLYRSLATHLNRFALTGSTVDERLARLHDVYERHGYKPDFDLSDEQALNASLMAEVAEVLQLPPELLVLRAKQAQLSDSLRQVDWQISEKTKPGEPEAVAATPE